MKNYQDSFMSKSKEKDIGPSIVKSNCCWSNLHIAKLELEMGDNSHCLDLYDAAIRHYETALTICKNILKDSNNESGVSKESRKIITILFENLTCSLLCDKKYSLALNYNDFAYEDRISEFDLFFKSTTSSMSWPSPAIFGNEKPPKKRCAKARKDTGILLNSPPMPFSSTDPTPSLST